MRTLNWSRGLPRGTEFCTCPCRFTATGSTEAILQVVGHKIAFLVMPGNSKYTPSSDTLLAMVFLADHVGEEIYNPGE
jgi:hypothetical protein